MKIDINKTSGKWLVNGKPYEQLNAQEKDFFNQFIVLMKIRFETEKNTHPKKEQDELR